MRERGVALIILTLSYIASYAGWMKTYGGSGYDYGRSVQKTRDGGYIIAGIWGMDENGEGGDLYLLKTDSSGNVLWTKTYGGDGEDGGYSVQQTKDGGYIIVGYTSSFGALGEDLWLLKTDEKGDTLWTKRYGGVDDESGKEVQQTGDFGYIIAGGIYSTSPPTKEDFWLLKTDEKGDTLWTKTYGGEEYDWGYSVKELRNGGYIIAGGTNSFGLSEADVWLLRTDEKGDTLWTKLIGGGNWDWANCIQKVEGGGFIMAGATSPAPEDYDLYIVRTDSSGNPLWIKTYPNPGYDRGEWVEETRDGGFIIAGRKEMLGNGNVWLIKVNGEGDTLWTRTFGGEKNDWGESVQQTADGGYIIVGATESFGAGGLDVWVIKTDSLGNIGIEEKSDYKSSLSLRISSLQPFKVSYTLPFTSDVSFEVFDISGRKVETFHPGRKEKGKHYESLPITTLPSGVYFICLRTDQGVITKKGVFVK